MQLLLSFVHAPLDPAKPHLSSGPDVWQTLDTQQRIETLFVLARLLAKAAAAHEEASSTRGQRRSDDE
jgi:hypothetical protein